MVWVEKLVLTITGVEGCLEKFLIEVAGDNVGILLRGIEKTDIKRGIMVIYTQDL